MVDAGVLVVELWGHKVQGSGALRALLVNAGYSKIGEFRAAVCVYEDVVWGDIAMRDACLVTVLERREKLLRVAEKN